MSGKILYTHHQDVYLFKLIGDVRVTFCSGLDNLIDTMMAEETINGVVIDMCSATNADSTTLGLLAKMATSLAKRFNVKPSLFSTGKHINRVLYTMGLGAIFDIRNEEPTINSEWKNSLAENNIDSKENLAKIIDAHRHLMELNEHNKATFTPLMTTFEKTLLQPS